MFCFCKNQRLQPEKEDDGSITATSAAEKGGREELRTERGEESFKTQKVSEKKEREREEEEEDDKGEARTEEVMRAKSKKQEGKKTM